MDPECYIALKEEVNKFLDIGFIRKSFYPDWPTNPVLVKKPNSKWKTCVDFTNLNKTCPKGNFLLPHIDQLVDAMSGHALLTFMDAYSGYNQISMYELDEEHTLFITDRELYYFKVIPFGMKNERATYQRLVNTMSGDQIRKTMQV